MSESKFFYSYTDFVKERINFKKVDREGINRYDSPAALYYKLVFYFTKDSGLLGLNEIYIDDSIDDIKENIIVSKLKKPFNYNTVNDAARRDSDNTDSVRYKNVTTVLKNTAYNYLLLNAEYERAHMLKSFITLLSEINSSSPWYFQEITGLDTALERKMFSENEFKLEDKPRQIAIKCLHDAYDDRIGTLLDLYRAACFSYTEKKEVVPANLRKFNMGVLVFSAPIRGKGGKSGIKQNRILIPDENTDSNYYIPSAKLIELRNCEIDYNSSKSAWGTLNTSTDPFSPEYTITISFDDCYENRYNEIMGSVVTDFINADINLSPNVKTVDDNSALGMATTGVSVIDNSDRKYYWLDSDYSTGADDLYHNKMDYNSNTSNVNIDLNTGTSMAANVLTTQWNNLVDKGKEFIQVPSFKNNKIDDNIHDFGRVNMYGEFEYLNRLSGMNGILGNVVQQATGGATNFVRKEAAKLYLGNIRSWSVSNAIEMGKRFLSGDVAGGIQDIERLSGKEGELVRPIGGKRNIGEGLPDGGFITTEIQPDPTQRNISETYKPLIQNISGGRLINRNLNKGGILDVDDLNRTIWDEELYKDIFTETHYAIKNIHENTSKTSIPREMSKRMNDPEGNPIDDRFITSEIHDGGEIGRALNKGEVLDVDVLNHTIGSEHELAETHFTTENIHDNTSKIPVPRKMPKRHHDPDGNPIDDKFITSEIWPDPIQRNLYKGELIDEDVVNSTLGSGTKIDGKMAWTGETTEAYLRNMELYEDPSQRNIEGTPTQTEISKDPSQRNIEGTPTQVEIWKDPFQRNIDSNMTSELPGYIKGRTKFLNEMNTHQSLRNNI